MDQLTTPTPPMPILLDRERYLRYDGRAFRRMESKGLLLTDLGETFQEGKVSISVLCDLLWAGLAWEDPDLTQDDVDGMISMENLQPVLAKVLEALSASMPKQQQNGHNGEGGDAPLAPRARRVKARTTG